MPNDQHLCTAEERRRCEVLERRAELGRILVGPQRAPRATSPRQEALAQDAEGTIDEEGLVAIEQVVGTERSTLERGERIGGRPAARRRTRWAQNPSMACE